VICFVLDFIAMLYICRSFLRQKKIKKRILKEPWFGCLSNISPFQFELTLIYINTYIPFNILEEEENTVDLIMT
jgi:hypothetical protein